MDRITSQLQSLPPWANAGGTNTTEIQKTPAEYVAAIRRRFWLVASTTFAGFLLLAIVVIRMPDKYQSVGEVKVVPPEFDGHVSSMMASTLNQRSDDDLERFVANQVTRLRSRGLASRVGLYEEARLDGTQEDVAEEITESLSVRPVPGTNMFVVSMKGPNPARITMLLDKLLTTFQDEINREVEDRIKNSREHVAGALATQERELEDLLTRINRLVIESKILSADGESLVERRYEALRELLAQKRAKLDAMEHQVQANRMRPEQQAVFHTPIHERIAELRLKQDQYVEQAMRLERHVKNVNRDPVMLDLRNRLGTIQDQIQNYEAMIEPPPVRLAEDIPDLFIESLQQEITGIEQELSKLNLQIQESLPQMLAFRAYDDERKRKISSIETLRQQLSSFDILSRTRSQPVTITANPVQPVKPVWPPRKPLLAVSFFCSFIGSLGLVLLLEHSDKTVRSPEQVSEALQMPLFGVVPRIRRHPKLQRAGHLWTTAVPHSLEADSYRNLRASILGGVNSQKSNLRQILVTSAKAGEGKSTTALNLAATFARAGERTILVDADLRRPSLGGLVGSDENRSGLVDVLCGRNLWQEVVLAGEIPHLDLMMTGQVGQTPIEILGSRELRQLLAGLSKHYDRVILDGPAVLGLADCRMLGQIVDGCLMVVRANPRNITPIQRAKLMLEQSRVPLLGIVYNGLTEDYRNWSSYGSPAAQVARNNSVGWEGLQLSPHLPSTSTAIALADSKNYAGEEGSFS